MEELINRITEQGLWHRQIILDRGAYLTTPGQIDTNFYLVRKGTLKIFFLDEMEERVIRLGYPGNLIAALDALISGKPTFLYVQAIKKTTMEVLRKSDFDLWLKQDPENMMMWHKITLQLIYDQMEREKDILTSSASTRYERVLERSPQLFQEIPNKHIASYLRMTPETLSRIKSVDIDQD